MGDPSGKRVLSDGVRVSKEPGVVILDSDLETKVSGTGGKIIQSSSLETNEKHDSSTNRAVGVKPRSEEWESWRIINMAGRLLSGKLSMNADEKVEDVITSKNLRRVNPAADMNSWQGGIGNSTSKNGIGIKRTTDDKDSDNLRGGNVVDHKDAWQGAVGEPAFENRTVIKRTMMDKKSDNLRGGNLIYDVNSWQGATGAQTSKYGIAVKRTAVDKDSDKSNSGHLGEGIGLTGNRDLVFNEMVTDGKMETEEVSNVSAGVLVREGRRESYVTEKEGEYYVSDLVWGKVRSHPWWPGQIVAPSVASDKATYYFKSDSYLIAYFGDKTFAWNEVSKIKPFRTHFSQMEKQSNAAGFCRAVSCALDEVARRVEFGLSCPCLPREVHDKIKYQVVSSAGIQEESSKVAGGDSSSSAPSFVPGELVQFLESLAESPQSKTDGLQFAVAKSQLLAFNRWKGRYQLPVLEEFDGLLEDDIQGEEEFSPNDIERLHSIPTFEVPSSKRKSTAPGGSSLKRKQIPGDEDSPKIKEKSLSVLMSSSSNLQNDEQNLVSTNAISSGKSSENVKYVQSNIRRKWMNPLSRVGKNATSSGTNSGNVKYVPKNFSMKRQEKLFSTSPSGVGNYQNAEMVLAGIPAPDVILSKLIVAAKNPMQVQSGMTPVVSLLRDLRKSTCLENSSSENAKVGDRKRKGKEPSILEGTEDAYWTDRIIQNDSQDRAVKVGANKKEKDIIVVDLESDTPSVQVNEVPEEQLPTAFNLNFSNLEAIPPVTKLNEIFSRFGPLIESETRVLSKKKRAKLMFKRRADAEKAFSTPGKYQIFGPSLVSYSLHYCQKMKATERP